MDLKLQESRRCNICEDKVIQRAVIKTWKLLFF